MTERRPRSWRDVLPLAQAVYARSCTGCCAHILIDDGNVEDSSAQHCLDFAWERGHPDCIVLCEALVACSRTQRLRLYNASEKDPDFRPAPLAGNQA